MENIYEDRVPLLEEGLLEEGLLEEGLLEEGLLEEGLLTGNNGVDIGIGGDSDTSSEGISCRVCLEDDVKPGGWIDPCQCAGSQRWIHVECLEKWRVTSTQESAMTECPTCLYRYRTSSVQPYRGNVVIDNICLGISQAKCCFIIFNIVLLATLTFAISSWDVNGTTLHKIFPFLPIEKDTNFYEFWLLTLIVLLGMIYLIFFLISFIFIRKKKLYLQWILVDRCFLARFLVMCAVIVLAYCFLDPLIMAGLIFFIFLMIILDYVTFLKRLDINNRQVVLPYDGRT